MTKLTLAIDLNEVQAVLDAPWNMGDDIALATTAIASAAVFPVPAPIQDAFWLWYNAHAEDVILEKRILLWTVEVRVKHLLFLFERFFGQQPQHAGSIAIVR